MKSMDDLFLHFLQESDHAEKHGLQALARVGENAGDKDLGDIAEERTIPEASEHGDDESEEDEEDEDDEEDDDEEEEEDGDEDDEDKDDDEEEDDDEAAAQPAKVTRSSCSRGYGAAKAIPAR